MFGVLITEISLFCRDAPVYAKTIIQDANATISLWMIELITLILEDCGFAKHSKTMCKSSRYKELLTKLTIDN